MNKVVLVNKNDKSLGLMERLEAHQGKGRLHRAVSVLLYRKKVGKLELLLQRRVGTHPLWPLYWSNTVCTHPREGETYIDCGVRRLKEEMGIKLDPSVLRLIYKLLYFARFNRKLSEREVDGILLGEWDGKVTINKELVEDYKWVGWRELKRDISSYPDKYAPWFKLIIRNKEVVEAING